MKAIKNSPISLANLWNCIMTGHMRGSGLRYRYRTLKVEQLEGRAMLAGNVSLSVDRAGNLFVTGDNHDNAVLIQEVVDNDRNPHTHAYAVTGFNLDDAGLSHPVESGPTAVHGGVDVGV